MRKQQLYRLGDAAKSKFWNGAVEDMLQAEVLVPVEIDYEAAARTGHETYERIAPHVGYSTRQASRVEFDDLDTALKIVMRAAYRAGVDAAIRGRV